MGTPFHNPDCREQTCRYCAAEDGVKRAEQRIGHRLTRRMTFEVTHKFSDIDAATARLAAQERGCSLNKVLRERLRADVVRVIRNAGYTVDNA